MKHNNANLKAPTPSVSLSTTSYTCYFERLMYVCLFDAPPPPPSVLLYAGVLSLIKLFKPNRPLKLLLGKRVVQGTLSFHSITVNTVIKSVPVKRIEPSIAGVYRCRKAIIIVIYINLAEVGSSTWGLPSTKYNQPPRNSLLIQ